MRSCRGTLAAVLACVLGGAAPSMAASLGGRLWFVDYDFDQVYGGSASTRKGGTSPMFVGQVDAELAEKVTGSFMLGYGSGWDKFIQEANDNTPGAEASGGSTRLDALAGLSYQFQYLYVGAALHALMVEHEAKNIPFLVDSVYGPYLVTVDQNLTYYYFGPEALVGSSYRISDLFLVRGAVSLLPILGWSYSETDSASTGGSVDLSATGLTWGYSIDVGVIVTPGRWRIGAGYRAFEIAQFDVKTDAGDFQNKDTFGGPYISAGIAL